MKEIQYKKFSWDTHKKGWGLKQPNVCQFELTFGCGLNCNYCYISCYNKSHYIKKELNTKQVKFLLDKIYEAGIIWLCFTGGDPLSRKDFLDIYVYAKKKGFIVTVFTNGYSMTKKIADKFKEMPPFVIEMTLNGVSRKVYEKITRVRGSYAKAMSGIRMMRKRNLPLKIKTQVTKDNLQELPKIKEFVKNRGLVFHPSADLYARLNCDLAPCNLRISPREFFGSKDNKQLPDEDECRRPDAEHREPDTGYQKQFFPCAIGGGDGIQIDPYGHTFACSLIRKPSFNLLQADINEARNKILSWIRNKKFISNSKCRNCQIKQYCRRCPGRALVETNDMETPLDYYCELAKETARQV